MRRLNVFLSLLFCFVLMGYSVVPLVNGEIYGDVIEVTEDTWIRNDYPALNYGSEIVFKVGRSNSIQYKGLVDWDTSGHEDDSVSYIYLKVYGQTSNLVANGGECDMYVFLCNNTWTEGTVTYTSFSNDYDLPATDTTTLSESDGVDRWYYIDITNLYLDQLDDDFVSFYGICLVVEDLSGVYEFQFRSEDYSGTSTDPYIYYSGEELDEEGNPVGSGESGGLSYSWIEGVIDLVMFFIVILLPAGICGTAFNKAGYKALDGFVVGITLGVGMGVMAGLIPSYFLLVLGMVIVFLLMRGR